jgi:pimeloyl-ACP methyl ester carboxylesterase
MMTGGHRRSARHAPRSSSRRVGSVGAVYSLFDASHRGGTGSPLVRLRGFTGTWRTWELVLPALERHHDVLAPTLAGHAGGPPLHEDEISAEAVVALSTSRSRRRS